MLDALEARDIYRDLQQVSWLILDAIGCDREPHRPITRTRPWRHGKPRGVLYHYTGGPSGLKSMRWGNHPGWGNKVSSWHVTVFDRITDNEVGAIWVKHASAELRRLFPAPTVIMADWRWGTWHGNWTNDVTLGVENRNTGYAGGIEQLGKQPFLAGGRKWEPYTREQMVCNVNIGRVAHALYELDPEWILSHQCVWASKQDTGPAFPMHSVRNAVLTPGDPTTLPWLADHAMAPDTNEDDDARWEVLDKVSRAEPKFTPWVVPATNEGEDPTFAAQALYLIGFRTGPEQPDLETVRRHVRWFQRSTQAYQYEEAFDEKWTLKPDGICGPQTRAGLERRLKQLRLVA